MKLSYLAFAALLIAAPNVKAAPTSEQMCEPMAVDAARALADTNGAISEIVVSAKTTDSKIFDVVLTETGFGRDSYTVTTTGGHDCIVLSVSVVGMPTLRP